MKEFSRDLELLGRRRRGEVIFEQKRLSSWKSVLVLVAAKVIWGTAGIRIVETVREFPDLSRTKKQNARSGWPQMNEGSVSQACRN
jgi:hypothetical protein